jgi:hypothetical protein
VWPWPVDIDHLRALLRHFERSLTIETLKFRADVRRPLDAPVQTPGPTVHEARRHRADASGSAYSNDQKSW